MKTREEIIDEAVRRVYWRNGNCLNLAMCKGRLLPLSDALVIRDEFYRVSSEQTV